jgi:Tfp pilus assembly protein PilV
MTLPTRHRHGHRLAAALGARLRACNPRRQEGFLLVEVMISALLVALIVTATFNGLDVATRISKDQRHHDQAAILAAQSQEQLRSEPASALDLLETSPHKYTTAIGGETYTITQEAKPVSASGNTTGCNATESTAQTGANILVISRVSWPQQVSANRPEVKQASLITPPTGSAIEVDVLNGEGGGVSGITARAKFIPNEAGSYNTVEGMTSANGCVVLTGIQATKATVEIVEKAGYVTATGALKVAPKELTIAPNITTHYVVKYAEAGHIAAQYTYEGSTTYGGKEVKGDTFVAFNSETGLKPEYEVGSTAFEYEKSSEEDYRALTGTYSGSSYTATGSKYSIGRLFPFKAGWTVYAGDCPANNVGKEDEVGGVVIKAGTTTNVKIPLSYTKLSIYTGSSASLEKGELTKETSGGNVKIINTSCSGAEEPLNAYTPVYTHEQKETLTEGRLENPFQPFGNFQVCVDWKKAKAYTVSYTNSKASGSSPTIYLGQKTVAEKTAEATAEATAKTKREKEESEATAAKEKRAKEETEGTAAKKKREEEETAQTTAKTAREKKEKEEREKWTKEETEKKRTKAERESKEKSQKEAREKTEKEEKTAKEKRASEETALTTAKEKRASEETAAKAPKEKREKEEAEAKVSKENREKRETAEAANGVTVEAKASC